LKHVQKAENIWQKLWLHAEQLCIECVQPQQVFIAEHVPSIQYAMRPFFVIWLY